MPNRRMARAELFAEWFSALEARGECMQIRLGCCTSQRAEPEWYFLPHQEYDGIGGLQHVLEASRGRKLEIPRLRQSPPTRVRAIAAALRCLFRRRARPASFIGLDAGWRAEKSQPAGATALAWALLSERDTRELRDYVRSRNLSMNAWMLWTLSQVLRPHLAKDGPELAWIVPINMRGVGVAARDTENQASTLDVTFAEAASAEQVQKCITREQTRHAHFGVWKLLEWLALWGRAVVRRVASAEARVRKHGSFSNLGNLRSIRPPLHGSPREWWMAFNPVLKSRPVGAACLTYDGRLALTLQLHPALSRDPALAHAWLFMWIHHLFCMGPGQQLANHPASSPDNARRISTAGNQTDSVGAGGVNS